MAPTGDRSELKVALAAVAGAHGVRGELRLKLFSSNLESLTHHKNLFVGGVERRLLSVRDSGKSTAVVRLENVSDRSQAEKLRGSLVEIDREALPPLGEGEYYYADLIGLLAMDRDGNRIGVVTGVENYGAGDLLEIMRETDGTALIPFKKGIADLEDGRIVLDRQFLA